MQNATLADPTSAQLLSFRQPLLLPEPAELAGCGEKPLFILGILPLSYPASPRPYFLLFYSPLGKTGLAFEMLADVMVKAVSLLQESLSPYCNNPSLLLAIVLSVR